VPHSHKLPFRQIHLDFHTSPLIPDVGADFDAEEFAATLKKAHVDSITCFAKCHHGMSYYDTQIGVKHPSLKFDLLGQQIEACHKHGIAAPVYVTVVWDNYMGEQHPEWVQMSKDGVPVGAKWSDPGWIWMCMNTAYVDHIEAQTIELLEKYNIDGLFYDIVMQTRPGCCCRSCLASMKKLALDPTNDADLVKHSHIVIENFMKRMTAVVHSRQANARIFYNGTVYLGMEWAKHMTHMEIEALPTGGWGYAYFPFFSRYTRKFGLPTLGMTGRFHRSWADFGGLKDAVQLDFECGGMLANGSACSIGDQLHPRGKLDKAVYETIGRAYARVEAVEPWCRDAVAETQIALLSLPDAETGELRTQSEEGAAKMLLETHHQFDILDPDMDFGNYDLVVIPDKGWPNERTLERLKGYVAGGGKLLLSHRALVSPDKQKFALPDIGAEYLGLVDSYPDFFKPLAKVSNGLLDFEYVLYERASKVKPRAGTEVLAEAYQPYFTRTWEHFTSHRHSPVEKKADYPAAIHNGTTAYIWGPIFRAYQTFGNAAYRRLVENCIALLLPEKLVKTSAPSTTEVTLTKQGSRRMVHLVNYHALRRGEHVEVIEEAIPLRDVEISLRSKGRPKSAYTAPDRKPLTYKLSKGRVNCTIPVVREGAIVVFEY
jgi:hypothetical protein